MDKKTIKVMIGNEAQTYVALATNAPKDYDGFGTFTLVESGDEKIAAQYYRWVLVREEHLEWQTARYQSGLHKVETPEYHAEEEITRLLWERLRK